jgi:hypothetical protein
MQLDHYVARTYLKRWCDPAQGQPIRVYRKSDLKQFPCWPADVCAEPDGDRNPDYFPDPAMLGQFRSIFEPQWNTAVETVQQKRMTAGEKFIISGYWANLIATTPSWRTIGTQLFEKEVHSILPIITKDHPAPENVKISVEIDPNYIKALATKSLLKAAWQLYNQQWSILLNDTAHPYLTSDNPSAILPPDVRGGPAARILPLSPRVCVATLMDMSIRHEGELTLARLQAPPKGSINYVEIDAERAKFVNRLTVMNAADLVFSRLADAGVAALVEKYRDFQVQLEHTEKPTPANNGIFTQADIYVGKMRA